MRLFKFFSKSREERIKRCFKRNGEDSNAFLNIKGHRVYQDFKFAMKNVPCIKCEQPPNRKGHDHCIANLPNVENACCGHGERENSYIAFKNGLVVRGFYIDSCCRKFYENPQLREKLFYKKKR